MPNVQVWFSGSVSELISSLRLSLRAGSEASRGLPRNVGDSGHRRAGGLRHFGQIRQCNIAVVAVVNKIRGPRHSISYRLSHRGDQFSRRIAGVGSRLRRRVGAAVGPRVTGQVVVGIELKLAVRAIREIGGHRGDLAIRVGGIVISHRGGPATGVLPDLGEPPVAVVGRVDGVVAGRTEIA